MKILALEYFLPSADPDLLDAYQAAQTRRMLDLMRAGVLREVYLRAEQQETVLVLECNDVNEAYEILHALPKAQAGLIAFEVIPLSPYDGFVQLLE
ncbi:MAG: hypothetical protein DDG60_07125 [Anaerolineae bacterium]|nr:MAG: hypothetical protein DDG60_07125 [Anaerolineae bacterium]